jgi:hypothetical protein
MPANFIGDSLLSDIRETISTVRNMPGGESILRIPTRFERIQSPVFRICTFTGAWSIGDTRSVTFKNQTTTPNTVSATNLFCGMSPTAQCDVSVAKDGTAWYVVQPNLSQQPGYSAVGTQVLTIVSGSLQWIGVSTCSTATAT